MPVKSSPPSRQQSSQKQQSSISSFFAAKPASKTPIPARPQPVLSPPPSSIDFPDDDTLFLQSDDDDVRTGRRDVGRAKRAVVDENENPTDSNNEPPAKRPRLASDPPTANGSPKDPLVNAQPTALRRQASGKISVRTSKYLFSSRAADDAQVPEEEDDEAEKARKASLHQRFVKKLGRPDSLAEIRRKNHILDDTTGGDGADAEDGEAEEEEPEPEPKPTKGKKGAPTKKGATKLTPMEKQFLEIKRKHMNTLLVFEVGYKFRFFGEDARAAAKELGIVCIPGKFRYDEHPSEAHIDRFAGASIPVHRLHVHVRRLVAAGHKVGVVRQIETAALKAVGDNRNTPFIRKLTNLYTKGTYIDDADGLDVPVGGVTGGAPAAGYLLCLTENKAGGSGADERVHVGIVAVQPATGDIIYDDFEDGFMRSEIETRLLHIAPCEFLIVGDLSPATEKLVHHLAGSKTNVFGDQVREERVQREKTAVAMSYNHVSNFYAGKINNGKDETVTNTTAVLDKVHKLSDLVTVCLSSMINHLQEYGLEHVFDLTKNFSSFSARSHMLLNGNTLNSLEVYRNQTDNSEKGSLFSILDQTQTRFGQRLLRKWVGRPLLDKTRLEERIDAVDELKDGERTIHVDKLKYILAKIRIDLEKSLIRIYYEKCTRPELLAFLQALQKVATEYAHAPTSAASFKSELINNAIQSLPGILEYVNTILEKINIHAAKEDDKYAFFRDDHETDLITEHKLGIASVEHDLNAHRKDAADKLKKRSVEYVTVAGIEFLIEVDNTYKSVPASWIKISGTKKVSRYHTPEVIRFTRERDQHKEALAAACDDAFTALLRDISAQYQSFRDSIQALSTLDCLVSLSEVARRPDYCKPTFTDEASISVVGGRHPMVEQLLTDAYVPNDIELSSPGTRALLITGPNMGGKSSYVRSIALIAIMSQIGSYVPAASVRLGMLDAVFTRMGAFDNMMRGESTFMVELSETADILKQATPRSLVILDELGRGTSTHDGVAIAQAVLDYMVRETKALTLFITHYQNLATVANAFEEKELRNVHMRFTEDQAEGGEAGKDGYTGEEDITFLYEIGEGVAHRSYGLHVARLAGLPAAVVEVAKGKSAELEVAVTSSRLRSLGRRMGSVLGGEADQARDGNDDDTKALELLIEGLEQL